MAPPFDNAFTEHHQPPNWINSNKTKRNWTERNGMETKKQDNFTQFHLSSHWYISHSYGL